MKTKSKQLDFLYDKLAPVMALLSPSVSDEFGIVTDSDGTECIRDQLYGFVEIHATGTIRGAPIYTVYVVSEYCPMAHDDPPPSIDEFDGLGCTAAIQKALEALWRLKTMDALDTVETERVRELNAHARSFPDDGTRTAGRDIWL